jgi:hypothetical protein
MFKDDVWRWCPHCRYKFKNPRLDLGCAEWCPYAASCLPGEKIPAAARGKPPPKS